MKMYFKKGDNLDRQELILNMYKEMTAYCERHNLDICSDEGAEAMANDFISQSIIDYMDKNKVDLAWDYEVDSLGEGITINIWEV